MMNGCRGHPTEGPVVPAVQSVRHSRDPTITGTQEEAVTGESSQGVRGVAASKGALVERHRHCLEEVDPPLWSVESQF